jgi:streptomycin 6-kinase
VRVPESLGWWRDVPGGAAWLQRLPRLVLECADEWGLELGVPLDGGAVALVLRVSTADGAPAVLKLGFHGDVESEHEAAALAHWGGSGAVRLLREDTARRALLLEWCEPGTRLWAVDDDTDATRAAAAVLRRLHASPPAAAPFRRLGVAVAGWAEELMPAWEAHGRPFDRAVLDEAVAACRDLATCEAHVLLHQDLHGGNVVRSASGWVAIDPKPLVGDPAFDVASLVRDRRWLLGVGDDLARMRRRLDVLRDELGLDRERMRLWSVVHALAWGLGPGRTEWELVRCAELLHRA